MKKIIVLTILSLACSSLVLAQDIDKKDVPSVVLNAFQQKFSKAEDVEWELKRGLYEVDFEIDKYDHEVWITRTGEIVQHEQELPPSELPEVIKAAIKRDFKGYNTRKAEKLTAGDMITYKVKVENPSEKRKVKYDDNGKILENKLD